jgi:hypothetical protein
MCFSGLWFYLRNISQTNNDKSGLLPVGCLSCVVVNFSKRLFRLFSKKLFRLFSKRLFSSYLKRTLVLSDPASGGNLPHPPTISPFP